MDERFYNINLTVVGKVTLSAYIESYTKCIRSIQPYLPSFQIPVQTLATSAFDLENLVSYSLAKSHSHFGTIIIS